MLPWKKSKLDLIEEDKPSKQKGYAVSLNYAALASFAKSCPESALYRVGNMFKSRRRKVKITGDDPTYTVLYLGNATTIQSKGDGCTDAAVGKIWAKSDAGKSGTKMRLTVSSQGVRMVHVDDKAGRPGHLYLLHRITYCVADPRLPKVFAWIYRHEMKHKAVMLRCHAVLVSRPEKAKAMALLLYQTSATALAEFKRLKRRDDARHQQQQLIGERSVPLVPLRKLLNTQCCYKPPVERSRSAPKLGSITEDPLGEEEEDKAAHFECEDVLDTRDGGLVARDDQQELTQIINHLGEMSIGNDVRTLKADLKVTRLLSGESTGSESSGDSDRRLSNGLERISVQSPA
ncbi:protein FAM43A [Nerophis lumbriciformis]|uniref:protein FAM43A n=1 Tax=Nerophis lumbriciformis TaxID=546530 RepID=UPI002ADF8E5A|nr:protein FAM43A-like [Nerophis lumbriciformis]XP_061832304.1 protein FAM43A-like [Nerophis lumbriciformis]